MRHWCLAGRASLLAAAFGLVGCEASKTGEVTGTVTVDGQVPARGSSITFFPVDGKSQTAGGVLTDGKYTATVPIGTAKVEIRAPKPATRKVERGGKEGYETSPEFIEESLPAKYNDKTELTYEVTAGRQEKNWELKTK